MMSAALREDLKLRAEAVQARMATREANPEEGPLYPGEWKVTADGLSKLGWRGSEPRASKAQQPAVGEVVAAGDPPPAQEAGQASALCQRLTQSCRKAFASGELSVAESLKEQGPHYPCPLRGRGWQLNLWAQVSAEHNRSRPAIVVTSACVRQESDLVVLVSWVYANISASDLWIRLTEAPPEVNEPGPEGLWLHDACPTSLERLQGEATVHLTKPEISHFYVRVYCCRGLDHGETFLGYEFGTSLRPLLSAGDEWSLEECLSQSQVSSAAKKARLTPLLVVS